VAGFAVPRALKGGTQRAPPHRVDYIVPIMLVLTSVGLAVGVAAGVLAFLLLRMRATPAGRLGVPEA